jgi:hypothetical protein
MSNMLLEAMRLLREESLPEVRWESGGDDYCDCPIQYIRDFANPYSAETWRFRMCCLLAELFKDYPQFVQQVPAYHDENTETWIREPLPWNSEDHAMPEHIWHRQVARQTGKPLSEVRESLKGKESPRPVAPGQAKQIWDEHWRKYREH